MTPEELEAKSKKPITAPASQTDFTIRKVSSFEMRRARLKSIIGNEDSSKRPSELEQTFAGIAMANQMQMDAVEYVLGTTTPKIVFALEKGLPVPSGCIDVSWVADDIDFIFEEIVSFSGLNPAVEKEIGDLKADPNTPATSTN